jgi:hypothetical protein
MSKKVILLVILFVAITGFSGCAIHSVDVQTITIPPQKQPVTVTVKGDAKCQDFILFYRVQEFLDIQSSDGTKPVRVQLSKTNNVNDSQEPVKKTPNSAPGTGQAGAKDDVAQLDKLKTMKERGLITQQEYDRKRKEIIDAM